MTPSARKDNNPKNSRRKSRPITSAAELERAYRDALTRNDPGKVADLDPQLRRLAQERTQEIEEAYGILKKTL